MQARERGRGRERERETERDAYCTQRRPQVMTSRISKGKATTAQMDLANKALCFALRNPPKGYEKVPYTDILKVVRKEDGTAPTIGAICGAAQTFRDVKGKRGRPKGCKKTTKEEDRKLLSVFKKLRPPGCGVGSRVIHNAFPQKMKKKICRRTVIRRLADKGYIPQKKIQKSDPGIKLCKTRIGFGKKYGGRTAPIWKSSLQAAGDMKEFTYYPTELRAKFSKIRAPWTYMNKKEKRQRPFVRPKKWFPKKDWKKVRKQKLFWFTTSNGKSLAFLVPKGYTAELWAEDVKKKVAPFLKKAFPTLSSFQILLDGEALLHSPVAKKAMKDNGISLLPGWPKYSPDLNPQENVWAWAEPYLRTFERNRDNFSTFQQKTLKAVGK